MWPEMSGEYHKFSSVMRASRMGRDANENSVAAAAEKISRAINSFHALHSTAKFKSANNYRNTKVMCNRESFVL